MGVNTTPKARGILKNSCLLTFSLPVTHDLGDQAQKEVLKEDKEVENTLQQSGSANGKRKASNEQ